MPNGPILWGGNNLSLGLQSQITLGSSIAGNVPVGRSGPAFVQSFASNTRSILAYTTFGIDTRSAFSNAILATVTLLGSTNGSPNATINTPGSGTILPGMFPSGISNYPAGTTVLSISGTTVVFSANATSAANQGVNFVGPVYTIPQAGRYQLGVGVLLNPSNPAANTVYTVGYYKNNTYQGDLGYTTTNSAYSGGQLFQFVQCSDEILCALNDTITPSYSHSVSTTSVSIFPASVSKFFINYIG